MLFLKPDASKKNREFFFLKFLFVLLDLLFTANNLIFDLFKVKFRRICMESPEHNWANISETICPKTLVFGK